MQITESDISCSTKQLTGVSAFQQDAGRVENHGTGPSFTTFLKNYIRNELNRRGAEARLAGYIGFMFSDRYYSPGQDRLSGGQKLARFITREGLGTIKRSHPFQNYNTQHHVRVYFFTPSDAVMAECRRPAV